MIRMYTPVDIQAALSPKGPVAGALKGFETRQEQIQMALEAQKAFEQGHHLVVEAGTGVGKSFAYLVPVIEQVCKKKGRVLVSTFTITLQEQLIHKDIPFLNRCLPVNFKAVLAKGRGNYLCKRRLEFAMKKQVGLFNDAGSELRALRVWANESEKGSLSEAPFSPAPDTWDAVKSEHGNCRGRRCKYFRDCFYWKARRRLEEADIVVANHALMFSDMVLKEMGASVLPEYSYVVVDEAHNIERVAEDHFGIDITPGRVKYVLDRLHNPRTNKGLLVYSKADKLIKEASDIRSASKRFFSQVGRWFEATKNETGGKCYKNFIDDCLSGHLKSLTNGLARLKKQAKDEDVKFEYTRYADLCAALVRDLEAFLTQKRPDCVYWVEQIGSKKDVYRLKSASLNVGEDVKRCLFDMYESVVLTSATLSSKGTEEKGGFEFFAGRIGLNDYKSAKLGSPFEYQRQVTVYIEKGLPDPNNQDFIEHASEKLKHYVSQTAGRAFVLFTSYSMLKKTADVMDQWFRQNKIELLQQGKGIDRARLLKSFKAGKKCALFGTDSFWQGVDIPGQALSNVIIVRLPFAVPNHPLLAGKLEQIRNNGGNPFFDYQLPSAVIKFKQGFGRLIRTKKDTGIVVVLDSRIVSLSSEL